LKSILKICVKTCENKGYERKDKMISCGRKKQGKDRKFIKNSKIYHINTK